MQGFYLQQNFILNTVGKKVNPQMLLKVLDTLKALL